MTTVCGRGGDDFDPPWVPKDVGAYKEYRRRSIEFIEARNHRIKHLDFL